MKTALVLITPCSDSRANENEAVNELACQTSTNRYHQYIGAFCPTCWQTSWICAPKELSCQLTAYPDEYCTKTTGAEGVWGWTGTTSIDPAGRWASCTTRWTESQPATGCEL